MNTGKVYLEGFIKRAAEYGVNKYDAIQLLKTAIFPSPFLPNTPKSLANPTAAPQLPSMGQIGETAGKYLGAAAGGAAGAVGYNPMKGGFSVPSLGSAMEGAGYGAGMGQQIGRRVGEGIGPAINQAGSGALSAVKNFGQGMMDRYSNARSQSYVAPQPTSAPAPGSPEFIGPMPQSNSPVAMPSRQSVMANQAPAAPQQGPDNAFLTRVMGSYNPNSKVDQAQAERVRQLYAQGKTTPGAIYADPSYRINREALGARRGANRSGYGG